MRALVARSTWCVPISFLKTRMKCDNGIYHFVERHVRRVYMVRIRRRLERGNLSGRVGLIARLDILKNFLLFCRIGSCGSVCCSIFSFSLYRPSVSPGFRVCRQKYFNFCFWKYDRSDISSFGYHISRLAGTSLKDNHSLTNLGNGRNARNTRINFRGSDSLSDTRVNFQR